ncbi:hypothetical protein [Piscinibacter terrae]|uniref:Uncharacterized protein n=1 Tax=Piscinibacter terrae TaxID=2496871 RepID=A0A3N7HKR0_9BURK|nr:hypothetical protein [Albitalea terrae]RQP22688.1 hypothetical protein DZC73_20500 [Albitalea terrae]
MASLESYHYLLDGSDPGWVLVRVNRQAVKLVLVFASTGPGVREVKAIRGAVPAYAALTASQALAKPRGAIGLIIEDSLESKQVCDEALRRGVSVRHIEA